MVYQLIRRHPQWLLMALLPAFCFLVWLIPRPNEYLIGMMTGMLGSIVMVIMTVGRLYERATLFEASLPIDGRDLLKVRVYIAAYLVLVPPLAGLAGALVSGRHIDWLAVEKGGQICILAATALVSSLLFRMPLHVSPWLWMLALVAPSYVGGIVLVANADRRLSWTVCLLAVLAANWWLRRQWPKREFQFTWADADTRGAKADAATAIESRTRPRLWPLVQALYPWQCLLWLAYGSLMPLSGSVMIPLCFLPIVMATASNHFKWLLGLPVSRRLILALVVLPYLTMWFLASWIDMTYGVSAHRGTALVAQRTEEGLKRLDSSVEYWCFTTASESPAITAPWGESHRPELHGYWLLGLYDPFHAGADASLRFRMWQYERATEAIYGRTLGLDELHGETRPRPVTDSPRIQVVEAGFLLAMSGLLVLLSNAASWRRFNFLSPKARMWLTTAFMLVPIAVIVAIPMALMRLGQTSQALHFFGVGLSGLLPEDWWSLLALLGGAIAGLAWLAAKQFDEYEVGVQATNCGEPAFRWSR